MNKTNIAIWVAVIAFAVSIVGLYTPAGKQVTQVIKEQLGGSPGPDRFNSRECIDSVCTTYKRTALVTATTTPCRIQGPNASSTLSSASFNMTSGTTTPLYIQLANTTDALSYASTTILRTSSVAANAFTTLVATGTESIIPPLGWVIVKVGGAPNGGVALFAPAGSCAATFQEM